jgi:hypothetical protein
VQRVAQELGGKLGAIAEKLHESLVLDGRRHGRTLSRWDRDRVRDGEGARC